MNFSNLALRHSNLNAVIATKIQNMHDQDPNVYSFADWGSPKGRAVSRLMN